MQIERPHNAIAANPDWPGAVIAGAFQTGVLGVRSLHRRGVRAKCFDCDPAMPGFHSVYGPAELCPDPDIELEAWLDFMIRLSGTFSSKPVLLPSSDRYVSAIASCEQELEDYFILSPGAALQGELADKFSQYELAASHSMPMPVTEFVKDVQQLESFADRANFPCLIKPSHFREWEQFPEKHPLLHQKIGIANNPQQLLSLYNLAAEVNSSVVLQEIIIGPDTNKRVYLSCYDREGERIANAMFQELRCDPIGFGPATVSQPIVDLVTDRICDEFLRSIGYRGICEIEMKWDDRDGEVKLIEANPRLSGGGDAAPHAGVDLCWLAYLTAIGEPVEVVTPTRTNFRHIMLRPDGRAIPAYWREGLLSFRELLRSYKPPLAFYDLDWRDWRYSLESIYVSVRLLFRELLRGGKHEKSHESET